MSSRVKFLVLIFLSLGGFSLVLMLFMLTDYAKEEQAYFQSYPYLERAAREKINVPDMAETVTTDLKDKNPSQEKIRILPHIQPEIQETQTEFSLTQVIPSNTRQLQILKKQQEIKILSYPSPAHESVHEKEPTVKKHLANPPEDNLHHAANLGYTAYNEADYKTAISQFERALKTAPNNRNIRLQLAYAYKVTGQNSPAKEQFKALIDTYNDDTIPFALRREVEQLENRFNVNGYVIYRDKFTGARQLGTDLTQSQAGMEISYHADNIGFNNGRRFQVYGRLLAGMKQDRLAFNPDSYQAGMGLRLKPLSNHNLVLSAERLVKLGDFARNDWMIRAGYSRDHGTDYRQDKAEWWHYSLYFDAALIDPASPDIFLTSQATGGYSMTVAEGLVLQPRLVGLISCQKDSFRQASLFEAGPGVNVRYHFNETKYAAYRSYIDLTVEYRIKLSGNSIGGSGPALSLLVHF